MKKIQAVLSMCNRQDPSFFVLEIKSTANLYAS